MYTFSAAAAYSSGMVLQQQIPLPVRGTSLPGAWIHCALNGQTAETEADTNGHWLLTLPPMPAGGPYTMTLTDGETTLEYTDVYIGEVWLAGGQSNMELELQNSDHGREELARCGNPCLHFYAVPKVDAPGAEMLRMEAESRWQTVTPDTAAVLSAVAYYAAKTLAAHLPGVHIGILQCCRGGTFAHCWLSRQTLASFPEGRDRLAEYAARMGQKTDEAFAAESAAYDRSVQDWNSRVAALRAAEPDITWPEINRRCGLFPWPPPAGRRGYQRPGNLYNAMLRRVAPYPIRGVWYYQGEQDEDHAEAYYALLTALVLEWRRDWHRPDLPFLLLQLPMYIPADVADPMQWPILRAAQQRVADTEPQVYLMPLTDCGEYDNIHPTDKRTPGTRLGLLALSSVYHQSVQGFAPRCVKAEFRSRCILLHFDQTGGGLALHGQGRGFEVARADGIYAPAKAVVAPGGCTVEVRSDAVPAPCRVRYAWFSYGPTELFGGTGLPAAPFAFIKE